MTIESPIRVLNPHAPLVQAAQLQRPEVDVPDPVVDFLQPDVLADADDRHVHPATIPPDPPIGADVPDPEAVRVLERRQPVGHRPRRGRVTRGRRLLVERLVRALVIELLAKTLNLRCCAARLPAAGRVVSAFSVRCIRSWRPFCAGRPGSISSGRMPRRTHHADSVDKRAKVFVANGTPLSERIRFGSPYSWNSCVKIGLAPSPAVAASAWQPRR